MADHNTSSGSLDASRHLEIDQHRGYLMRYALLQLRHQTAAEDAVQETLLAAVEGGARFSGKSSVKTWLTGILKHKIIEMCAGLMPVKTARVFVMREVMELSTEEICKELGITATNCWVMLHRARLSLRECLELKWFGGSR